MLRMLLKYIKQASEAQDHSIDENTAEELGARIGIDWGTAKFPVSQFQQGMQVELEHGSRDQETNVTSNDLEATGRIAWAHLKEMPDYYTRLKEMEKKGNGDESGPEVPKDAVIAWLKAHPNPEDSSVHAWAEEQGWNKHKVEEVIYQLATEAAKN